MSDSAHKAGNDSLNFGDYMGTTGEGQLLDFQTEENGEIPTFVFLTLRSRTEIHLEYQQI